MSEEQAARSAELEEIIGLMRQAPSREGVLEQVVETIYRQRQRREGGNGGPDKLSAQQRARLLEIGGAIAMKSGDLGEVLRGYLMAAITTWLEINTELNPLGDPAAAEFSRAVVLVTGPTIELFMNEALPIAVRGLAEESSEEDQPDAEGEPEE